MKIILLLAWLCVAICAWYAAAVAWRPTAGISVAVAVAAVCARWRWLDG